MYSYYGHKYVVAMLSHILCYWFPANKHVTTCGRRKHHTVQIALQSRPDSLLLTKDF